MDKQLIIMIVFATVGIMLMAFSLVFFALLYKRRIIQNKLNIQEIKNQYQKSLLKATLKSQEEERNKLGVELHDSVGAMLSSIKMNLSVVSESGKTEDLKYVITHLNDTIKQVRTISHQMMPIVLKKYGVQKAIEDLFDQISNEKIDANIATWEDPLFDEDNQTSFFRIVQELTNNTLKHSRAENISLFVYNNEESINIRYEDDGIGFPKEVIEKSEGMGMWNILNRAQSLTAKVRFVNPDYGGARVEFLIEK